MRRRLTGTVVSLMLALAGSAHAQLGEVHAGVLAGYGTGEAYGGAAGVVLGVAAGRIVYAGLRWTYHEGSTTRQPLSLGDVRTRVQIVALDLGAQIPVGPLEIVPSVSVGINTFTQRALATGALSSSTEFLTAPGLAVEMRFGRLGVIPEVQYYFAGSPRLPSRVDHRALMASVRIVYLSEMRRIRR